MDQQGPFFLRMFLDTGQPMKKSVQTQRADPGRQLNPERPDGRRQKKAVVTFLLVERENEKGSPGSRDVALPITRQQLSRFNFLKTLYPGCMTNASSLVTGWRYRTSIKEGKSLQQSASLW